MLLIKDIWAQRHAHYLTVVSLTVSLTLVLSVSILSGNLVELTGRQISSLGADASLLQCDATFTLTSEFVNEYKIGKHAEYYRYTGEQQEIIYCGDLDRMLELQCLYGRFLDACDVQINDNVAVLGYGLWQQLERPLIGENIWLQGMEFTVKGVLNKDSGNLYADYDRTAFIPLDYRNNEAVFCMMFVCDDPSAGLYLKQQLGNSCLLIDQSQASDALKELTMTAYMVTNALALCSLAVSVVSLINNMMALLKSRTYQIGIKKALGAGKNDIIRQFVMEGIMILSVSLLISLLLTWLLINSVSLLTESEYSFAKADYSLVMTVLAVAVLSFFFPAYKAGGITVMEAIKNNA